MARANIAMSNEVGEKWRHKHRCLTCGDDWECDKASCIGDGSVPPSEGYLDVCDAYFGRCKHRRADGFDLWWEGRKGHP